MTCLTNREGAVLLARAHPTEPATGPSATFATQRRQLLRASAGDLSDWAALPFSQHRIAGQLRVPSASGAQRLG